MFSLKIKAQNYEKKEEVHNSLVKTIIKSGICVYNKVLINFHFTPFVI